MAVFREVSQFDDRYDGGIIRLPRDDFEPIARIDQVPRDALVGPSLLAKVNRDFGKRLDLGFVKPSARYQGPRHINA